jgi:GGDEF domain-containing protein
VIAILIIDLDLKKRIDDTHAAGDEALKAVARVVAKA